jgi:hypothetical protein
MSKIYFAVQLMHITAGLVGLAAFWLPAIVRKGGKAHVQFGRVFFWATCAVAATGIVMASGVLAFPLGVKPLTRPVSPERAAAIAAEMRMMSVFLFYLVIITFTPVYHGVRVLATRRAPEQLRTPFHTFTGVAAIGGSVAMIAIGIVARQPVLLFMSPIGVLIGIGQIQFARRPYATPMAWWYEHMGSMLGGGIAFHTAFLVLGAGRLFGLRFDGLAGVIPWVLPTIVGVPASEIWVRYYRRKFNEDKKLPTAPARVRSSGAQHDGSHAIAEPH